MTSDFYSFVDRPTSEFYSVRINEGQFRGVIVTYGAVSFRAEGDSARLKFTFKIEEVPAPLTERELNESKDFKNTLGDILSHILHTSFETGGYKLGNAKRTSNHNPPEDSNG